MSGDADLDRLMAKRLAEMRSAARRNATPSDDAPRTPRDILIPRLGHRGMEVLECAEAQFPQQTAAVVSRLAGLISSGQLHHTLDGGQLLYMLRLLGLHVRMPTRISVEQDGKMVSLSDRIRGSEN